MICFIVLQNGVGVPKNSWSRFSTRKNGRISYREYDVILNPHVTAFSLISIMYIGDKL